MRTQTIDENRRCPKCGRSENQINAGYNRSGTQRCECKFCNYKYTPNGKTREYPEETKRQAMKTYYSGVSGRGVGKLMGIGKGTVYDWIKKTAEEVLKSGKPGLVYELDELYWFIKKKAETETKENVYLMTMISPEPRMIVGLEVAMDKGAVHIQSIVDGAPEADFYRTDAAQLYLDVVFPGDHVRNIRDKKDTHNVESINADLRTYIPVLARRSRCFCRSLETLQAVVEVFVDAYNAFGIVKLKHRVPVVHKSLDRPIHLHKFLLHFGLFIKDAIRHSSRHSSPLESYSQLTTASKYDIMIYITRIQ